VESLWRTVVSFPNVHSRTIYSLSWLAVLADVPPREDGGVSLGKLASAGGDGFIRVFEVVSSRFSPLLPPSKLKQPHLALKRAKVTDGCSGLAF
jgi:hypothetical protein